MACLIETGKLLYQRPEWGEDNIACRTERVTRLEWGHNGGGIYAMKVTANQNITIPQILLPVNYKDKHRLVLIIIPEKSLDLSMAYLHVNVDQLQNNSQHAASPVYGLIYLNCH